MGCDTPTEAIEGSLGIAHKISINKCVNCAQCLINCLFGAIEQMIFVDEILKCLDDPKSFAVVHQSPAVRVSIAEEFERNPGDFTISFIAHLKKQKFSEVRVINPLELLETKMYIQAALRFIENYELSGLICQ